MDLQGVIELVKGVSRRVIVIKSPDKNIFEEAIFIVREDAFHKGITRDEIVRQAQEVANDYLASNRRKSKLSRLPGFIYALMGAGFIAGVYYLVQLL